MTDSRQGDARVEKTLRFSILDGAFASSMIGLGESYFIAFAVFLNANNIQLGVLSTLPQAIGALVQLSSRRLVAVAGSRRRLVATSALLQGLTFIPIILAAWLDDWAIPHLMLFVCLYWVFGMVLGPAWNSWIGDLTEARARGDYFGLRSKVVALFGFCSFVLAGAVLELFTNNGIGQLRGFAAIFTLALLARMISVLFISRQYEPEYMPPKGAGFGFTDFLREERFAGFRVYSFYYGLMNLAVYTAAPFFVPYMLKDLKLGYLTFTLIQAAAVGMKFIAMPIWGRISDQFGARKVIVFSGLAISVVPFLWFLSPNTRYLVMVELLSGMLWAGYEISTLKFAFDTTSTQDRVQCMSYHMLINGACLLAGALIGSVLVRYNQFFWSKYLLVFLLSAGLRLVITLVFMGRIRETASVEEIHYGRLFLKVISMMPAVGFMYSLVPFRKKNRTNG